ncbi:hypothetical protein D9M71_705180 [compost metagenome]
MFHRLKPTEAAVYFGLGEAYQCERDTLQVQVIMQVCQYMEVIGFPVLDLINNQYAMGCHLAGYMGLYIC